MKVLHTESVLIKEELETITLKPGKSCQSLSVKKIHFVMQVIIKNNLSHKKQKKK